MGFKVTSVTTSMEISVKDFGSGTTHFASLKAESDTPDAGIDVENLEKVCLLMLDTLHSTHRALQLTRFAQKELTTDDLNTILNVADRRFAKVKQMLQEHE